MTTLLSIKEFVSSFIDGALTLFEWFAALLYLSISLVPFIILFYCLA